MFLYNNEVMADISCNRGEVQRGIINKWIKKGILSTSKAKEAQKRKQKQLSHWMVFVA